MSKLIAASYIRNAHSAARDIDTIWVSAYAAGLQQHGIEVTEASFPESIESVQDADFHFCWSFKHPALVEHCRRTGQPLVVLEHGYTPDRRVPGRATWENQINVASSVNLNGLNGESEFDMSAYAHDSSRCELHGWRVTPRTQQGDKTIVIGQITGDQSLKALPGNSIYSWAAAKISELSVSSFSNDVLFKPHPLEKKHLIPELGVPVFDGTMDEVLRIAGRIATYSSTAGVDAWLNGVSATADSPVSMIYKYQNRGSDPQVVTEWLNSLSFLQFKFDEIRSGLAWDIHGQQVLQRIGHLTPRKPLSSFTPPPSFGDSNMLPERSISADQLNL